MANLRCYHHCNCEDRPAVAQCSECGKGLCRECADKLTSPNTGKLLCADCLNKEIAADEAWANRQKAAMRRELIVMIVGFALGVIIQIILGVLAGQNDWSDMYLALFVLSFVFCLPTLFASFGTIIGTVGYVFDGWFMRTLFFLILVIGSPIMFIVRVVRRVRKMTLMKRFAEAQVRRQEANKKYKELAEKMNTRLETMEEFERKLTAKFENMMKTDRKTAEAKIAAERAEHQKKLDEQEQKIIAMEAAAVQLKESNATIEQSKADIEKQNKRNKKKLKSNQRSNDRVA